MTVRPCALAALRQCGTSRLCTAGLPPYLPRAAHSAAGKERHRSISDGASTGAHRGAARQLPLHACRPAPSAGQTQAKGVGLQPRSTASGAQRAERGGQGSSRRTRGRAGRAGGALGHAQPLLDALAAEAVHAARHEPRVLDDPCGAAAAPLFHVHTDLKAARTMLLDWGFSMLRTQCEHAVPAACSLLHCNLLQAPWSPVCNSRSAWCAWQPGSRCPTQLLLPLSLVKGGRGGG